MSRKTRTCACPLLNLLLVCGLILTGCTTPRAPLGQPTGAAPSAAAILGQPQVPEQGPTLQATESGSTPEAVRMRITSQPAQSSVVTHRGGKCGHASIVAVDGHLLRSSPYILPDRSNHLERLAEGTQVDITDCQFLINQELQVWAAVRTAQGKLGWILVQPDAVNITVYPRMLAVRNMPVDVPIGATVAYISASGSAADPLGKDALASIAIDFVPIIGDAKGIAEAATGYDWVTGERLGHWRWLGLLGLIGLAEVARLRHGDEVADGARAVTKLDDAARQVDQVALGVRRHADEAGDALKAAGKLHEAPRSAADAARLAGNAGPHADEAALLTAKFEQPCSFCGDTLVSTERGLTPMSQISPGDRVLAYSESLRATGYYTVTAVSTHVDTEIITLLIGTDEIETTPEHPFFVLGEWVPAGDLVVGVSVSSASGVPGRIQRARQAYQPKKMYNLTVAEAHTYFVGTGQWLVHNACSRVLRKNLLQAGQVPEEWIRNEVPFQAHHVIPGQWEEHNFVKRAMAGGWDIDGADNGVALPVAEADAAVWELPRHSGRHPGYSNAIRVELDELEEMAAREGWSNTRAAQEMGKLVQRTLRQWIGW